MGVNNLDPSGDDNALFSDINVTPLVDVMLVLLIVFMVTAPFMVDTIGVNLPKGSGEKTNIDTQPLTISIMSDESIKVADQAFSLDQLKDFISNSPRIKNGEEIYVEADKDTRHGVLMNVMSQAHLAGASKINIMMERP